MSIWRVVKQQMIVFNQKFINKGVLCCIQNSPSFPSFAGRRPNYPQISAMLSSLRNRRSKGTNPTALITVGLLCSTWQETSLQTFCWTDQYSPHHPWRIPSRKPAWFQSQRKRNLYGFCSPAALKEEPRAKQMLVFNFRWADESIRCSEQRG